MNEKKKKKLYDFHPKPKDVHLNKCTIQYDEISHN